MDRERALEESLRLITDQRADEAVELLEAWRAETRDPVAHGLLVYATFVEGRHDESRRILTTPHPGVHADPVAHACTLAAAGWLTAAAEIEPHEDPFVALPAALAAIDRTDRVGAFVGYLASEGALAAALLDLARDLHPTDPAPREVWAGHPYAGIMLACEARLAIFSGRIDEARALLSTSQPDGIPGNLIKATAALAAGNAADLATMRRLVAEVAAEEVEPRDHLGRGIHLLLAYSVLALGDRAAASRHLLTAGGDADLAGLTVVDRALGYEVLVAAAVDECDLDAAASWLARAEQWAEHRAAAPCLERMRARVALLSGEAERATHHAEQAVLLARADGRSVEAAEGEVVLAQARIAADDVPTAAQSLRGVVADTDQQGHHALRHAASRMLRTAGRRLPPILGGGHAALSPRERDVADLILAGCDSAEVADRLHLSPATVRTHVSRVLAAYGVSTRIGLLAAANDVPDVPVDSPDLTPQQARVAEHVALGRTNQQIAEHLGISVKGVEKHVGDVLHRWGATTRFGIARTWWDQQT